MSNEHYSRPQKRAIRLLDFLEDLSNRYPEQETFTLRMDGFSRFDQILSDPIGLKKSLELIQEKSRDDISFTWAFIPTGEILPGVTNDPNNLTGIIDIKIHIEDPSAISTLKRTLFKKTRSAPLFYLYEKGNKAVFKKERGIKECKFSKSGKRYKLFEAIIKARGFIPTEELAYEFFGGDKDRVRSEITIIRERLTKELGVKPEDIIENEPGKGYRFLNIHIEE